RRPARGAARRRRRRLRAPAPTRDGWPSDAMNERTMIAPIITFLSDYGLEDEFVGVCHGVIARRCPQARVIDLTHGIPPYDVRAGALVLAAALPHVPAGVHLAVVDPHVGAVGTHARRAVALRTATEERLLVGPDNGLLMLAAERFGGALQAAHIPRPRRRAAGGSRAFHGGGVSGPDARPHPPGAGRQPGLRRAAARGRARGSAARASGVSGAGGAGILGQPRLHLRQTDSTNDRARELAGAGAPHGTLVTTAEQTAGRGRHGRCWLAPAGSALLMSLLLRSPPPLLPLAAAVAVCDVAGSEA